ncbi:hypothetical protein HUJ04_011200 [Dendroctonus ponderosae]|nr:hypothetical protein HUJ04_011200 [Dendroctonus ponderosae]
MKDKVYKVEVRNNLVSSILITLPALEECDAILAKECLWNKPTTKEETEVKTADDLYPPSNWLLRKDEPISRDGFDVDIPLIEDIITSEDFLKSSNKIKFVKQKCVIDTGKIEAIAKITTGQTDNEKWFLIRKCRLTASHFEGTYSLDGIKSIQWGKTHERDVLNYLKNNLNINAVPTRIWMSKSRLFGVSSSQF